MTSAYLSVREERRNQEVRRAISDGIACIEALKIDVIFNLSVGGGIYLNQPNPAAREVLTAMRAEKLVLPHTGLGTSRTLQEAFDRMIRPLEKSGRVERTSGNGRLEIRIPALNHEIAV